MQVMKGVGGIHVRLPFRAVWERLARSALLEGFVSKSKVIEMARRSSGITDLLRRTPRTYAYLNLGLYRLDGNSLYTYYLLGPACQFALVNTILFDWYKVNLFAPGCNMLAHL